MSEIILIGMGANLGDRMDNLTRAVAALSQHVRMLAVSPVYVTRPWGVTDQPDFLNLCLSAQGRQTPAALLQLCQSIEGALGRQPGPRWGPRLIDIDLLFIGQRRLQTPSLTLPHPGVQQRAFVLIPLADIAPDFVDPVTGQRVAELARQVDASGVSRWPEAVPLGIEA